MGKGRMAKDTLLFLPAKVAEGVIVMLTTAFYTKLFLPEAYGSFQIINTTMLVAYLISASWLANAAVRYIGDELKKDSGKEFYSTLVTSYLYISGLVCAVCLIVYLFQGDPVWPAGAFMFAAYSLFMILNGMLVQTGLIRWSIVLSLLSVTLKLASAYLYVNLLPSGVKTPFPAVFASMTGDFIASVGALLALGIPSAMSLKRFSRPLFSSLMKYGFPLIGVSVSIGLLNMIDRYIVVFTMGKAPFAVYSANYAISSGIFTMLTVAVMRGVYPAVLGAWREGGQASAKPLLDAGARLYVLIALPCAAGLTAVGPLLSRVLFVRPEYHTGAPVIGITACAMFFMGLTEYANKPWELTKNTIPVLQNAACAAVLKVVASLLLIPVFGISGAAYGTLFAFLLYFSLAALRAKRIFLFYLGTRRVLNITVSSLLCALAAFAVTLMPVPRVAALAGAVFTGAAVYFAAIFLSGEIGGEISALKAHLKTPKL